LKERTCGDSLSTPADAPARLADIQLTVDHAVMQGETKK